MEQWNEFVNLVDGFKIITLVLLIMTNGILGLILAGIKKEFTLADTGRMMTTKVLPFIGSYLAVGVTAVVDESLKPAVVAAFGICTAALVGNVLSQVKALGVPLPEIITRYAK